MGFTRQQLSEIEQVIINALSKETVLKELKETIAITVATAVKTAMQELTEEIARLNEEVSVLKKDMLNLEKRMESRNDSLEQYTRRNNLRMFGVQEDTKEDVEQKVRDVIKKKLNIALEDCAVERCHRIGKLIRDKPRPIIIKFLSYKQRNLVFRNKKLLKGSSVVIREDLCSGRLGVYKEAVKKFGSPNVWTRDGSIVIKMGNRIKTVVTVEDFNDF